MSTSLLAGLLLVPISACACTLFARSMRRRALGERIREVGPAGHAAKAGTPTMGGLIIALLWAAAVGVLSIWNPLGRTTLFVLATGGLFAGVGALDDALSLRRRRSAGLSAPAKLVLSSLGVVGLYFAFGDVLSGPVQVPFTHVSVELPAVASFALLWFVMVGTTNGMNLADGLDGLSGGVAVILLVGLVLLRPTAETLTLAVPLIGALVGFLWINVHPAGLFLGDIGAYFLGGVVAAVALANGLSFLLPILGGVLVLESVSVILQVGSRRLFGRRIFRMAPFHHHFERGATTVREHLLPAFEWAEGKITVRFWMLGIVFLGLALIAARV